MKKNERQVEKNKGMQLDKNYKNQGVGGENQGRKFNIISNGKIPSLIR